MSSQPEAIDADSHVAARRGWFPPGLGAIAWLFLAAWVYFAAALIVVNIGIQLPRVFEWLFYSSSLMTLWGGPLWLFIGSVLALSAGLPTGTKRERVQLVSLATITVAYFVISALFD